MLQMYSDPNTVHNQLLIWQSTKINPVCLSVCLSVGLERTILLFIFFVFYIL